MKTNRRNKVTFAPGQVVLTATAALLLLTVGCGGSNDFLDPTGGMITPITPATGITEVQDNIFTPTCATAGCHIGASSPFGLDLSEGESFQNLFNVDSAEIRVEPNNFLDSYLYMKVVDDPRILGDPMPFNTAPLTMQQLEMLQNWISDGAMP